MHIRLAQRIHTSCLGAIVPVAGLLALFGAAHGAGYTYRGQLDDDGRPANGIYALRLSVFDSASSGTLLAGPVEFPSVAVAGGAFHVDLDLPAELELRKTSWLQVDVAGSDRAYVPLGARSAMTAVTGVCWDVSGNAGTVAGTNFLGTTDTQPLVLKAGGMQAAKLAGAANATFPGAVSVVLGASNNSAALAGATVGGGGYNASTCGSDGVSLPCSNAASGNFATIGGGFGNSADLGATVGGGALNYATAFSTIAGGNDNSTNGQFDAIGGGGTNFAAGDYGTIAGGFANHAAAYAAVPGGSGNFAAGMYSLAAGVNAQTFYDGTFVWSDKRGAAAPFSATADNQFLVSAGGGVGINTNAPSSPLHVRSGSGAGAGFTPVSGTLALFEGDGDSYLSTMAPATNASGLLFGKPAAPSVGAIVYNYQNSGELDFNTNGTTNFRVDAAGKTFNHTGTWSTFSDRRLKQDVAEIANPLETLLRLRGQTYAYIDPPAAFATPGRRMGFIAQDVEAVLPQWVSEDARGYKLVTPQGFEALDVEAIRELRAEKDAEIVDLRARLEALAQRLARLEGAQ